MSMQETIERKVRSGIAPAYLAVENESHRHNVPPGAESHFKLTVVSDSFESKPLIARHRMLHAVLAEELAGRIHALALHTYTPAEWQAKNGMAPKSPPCLGGSKAK